MRRRDSVRTRLPHAARLAALALAALAGCAPVHRSAWRVDVREITPPFLLDVPAADPAVAADGRGRIALTWVTHPAGRTAVWTSVSADSGAPFAAPVRLDDGRGDVVSFPESRPAAALGSGGALAAVWSERRADSSGAVDLRARGSADLGRTLGPVVTVNDDVAGPPAGLRWRALRDWPRTHRPDAFHGLGSVAFLADGGLLATWIDGRRTSGPGDPRIASLATAISRDGGQSWGPAALLSDSVCPCCRPDLAIGPTGAVALAYRDAANDVRDPALALSHDGGRTFAAPTPVGHDGWRPSGCPGEAPVVAWDGARGGSYVWLTGADPPGVYAVAWRADAGPAGTRRPVADSLTDARHPRVAPLGEAAFVAVEGAAPDGRGRRTLAIRLLDADGALGPWTFLGADVASNSSWLATAGHARVIACWVESESGHPRVRVAELVRRRV